MEFNKTDVYVFKLVSGEEVVARVSETLTDHLIIDHPLTLANTGNGVGLAPASFLSDTNEKIYLRVSAVSLSGTAAKQIRDAYIETVTGLKLPKKLIMEGV